MIKIFFRFFIICIIFTIIVAFLMINLYKIIDARDTLDNFKLLAQGTFYSLNKFLEKYPEQKWQQVLQKSRPDGAGTINIIPINNISLNNKQIMQIKKNQMVYVVNEISDNPSMIYKKIGDTQYVYQYLIDFNSIEKAKRFFGWAPALINNVLRNMPEQKWLNFLNILSIQYGYPISIQDIAHISIEKGKKEKLSHGQWIVDLPNISDDSIQMLYTPLTFSNKILVFGPIKLPIMGIYKKYILFTIAFIFIELMIFIIAILFARSLEKLKKLSENYGSGNFTSPISLSKTSSLYPLFDNLQVMGKKIQTLLNSQKHLINSISHELRTPLSQLQFNLELLKKPSDEKKQLERIHSMEENIIELNQLISEILKYEKLDYLQNKTEFQKISLYKTLNTAISNIKKINSKKHIVIELPHELNNTIIFADEKLVFRALKNLLENAFRFAKSTIKISVKKINGKHLQLIIEDDGPGIAMEDREKIFEPFQQLSNQFGENQGYGLGLAIVKKILDQHHWKIFITDSQLGGVMLVIMMPIQV